MNCRRGQPNGGAERAGGSNGERLAAGPGAGYHRSRCVRSPLIAPAVSAVCWLPAARVAAADIAGLAISVLRDGRPVYRECVGVLDLLPYFRPADSRAEGITIRRLLLGDVVAKLSGGTFEACVKRHVLEPLGMTDSELLLADVKRGPWARPYVVDDARTPSSRRPSIRTTAGAPRAPR